MSKQKTPLNKQIGTFLLWVLYSAYLYLAYHILLIPMILDFSIFGLVPLVVAIAVMVYVMPKNIRRQMLVYAVLFLLAVKAMFNIGFWHGWQYYAAFIPIVVVLALLARFYGKLKANAIICLLITSVFVTLLIPRNLLPVLSHFYIEWSSDRLYVQETIDYFPFELSDINQDGIMEIVTLGNSDELKQSIDDEEDRKNKKTFVLESDPLYPYIFSWQDGEMQRLMLNDVDMKEVMLSLPNDYPGFPYYVVGDQQLTPLIQRQELAEGMLQIGTSPFRAMVLNMENLSHQLRSTNGVLDQREHLPHSDVFHDLVIQDGVLIGMYEGKRFAYPTAATKIVDGIQVSELGQGILLLGKQLEILIWNDEQQLITTHTLSNDALKDVTTAEILVSDLDHDGTTELLFSFPSDSETPASIIKPLANGQWEIIWSASDLSFRFEDVMSDEKSASGSTELVVLDKSRVSNYNLRYLASYEYENGTLKRNWKAFLSLINVRSGDFDGDGKKELAASMYGSHKLYILERHNIPVIPILIGITFLLIGYGVVRRVRHAK